MARPASKLAPLAALLLPLSSPALAQEMPQVITPPEVMSDPNGLNLVSGKTLKQRPTISIPAAPRLSYSQMSDWFMYLDGQTNMNQAGTGKYAVHYGGARSEAFDCEDGTCEAKTSGSIFSGGYAGGSYTQEKSAVIYTFLVKILDSTNGQNIRSTTHYASFARYPDGEMLNFQYETYIPGQQAAKRVKKVTSNTGYYLQFDYWDSVPGGLVKVKTAAIYASADPTTPLAKLEYSSDGKQVSDLLGRTWSCSFDCGHTGSLPPWATQDAATLPGEPTPALTYTWNATNPFLTQSINRDGVGWSYAYGNVATQYNMAGILKSYKFDSVQVAGPNNYDRTYTVESHDYGPSNPQRYEIRWVLSSRDELNRTTSYTWNFQHKLASITYPEGNKVEFEYDLGGNPIKQTDKAKPGSGLVDIVQQASYNVQAMWRPDWYKDALNRQTDFTYNTNGQLTRQLDPADAAGVRKQTDITYTLAGLISRKTLVRVCGQTTSCSGNAESHVEYTYFGNTFLPATVTEKDEASGVTRVTAYSYDAAGRMLSEDGPLAGTADAKYFRYDAFGRRTWEIGAADPIGLRIAKRFTYRPADDKVSKVETGTIPDPNNTNLTLLEQVDTTYDSRRYPIREATSSGGTNYRVTDRSFLDRDLADCSTVRMNLGALPAPTATSACTLGMAGSQGPDRITKNVYDNASQLLKVQKAYLITTANGFPQTLQQDYATYAYTNNGKQQFVTDANGNKAQFTWDGFDRLSKWNFPSLTTPGIVSTTDYEQYGYDAAGNRLSLRRRDARTLTFTYDNLNRMLSKLIPDGCPPIQPPGTGCPAASATRDVFYGYDILGRQLTARFDSQAAADGVTNTYDGFGNLSSSTISMGGFTKTVCTAAQPCLYDADDNRIQVRIDGQAYTYAYDARDRLTGVYEGVGTGTPLDTFAWNVDDTLGSRNEGAGSTASFGYDPIGRLTSQTDAFPGGTGNVQWTFGLNPSSQIATETRTNDAYAFTGLAASNKAYATNGLNQYTAVAGTGNTYDANGNLTGDGTNAYVYDGENRLVSATAAGQTATLAYDPLGRLWQLIKGASNARFLYDGDALIGEFDAGGNLTNRYVHGSNAAADDPLLWYVGSGTGTKRYLHTDRLGSIVAATNTSGGPSVNAYDEYGVPKSVNVGRFQYTGQLWLSEVGLYYHKARLYSPLLGRFVQVDPIGYEGGMNLYTYALNDPMGYIDSTGKGPFGWLVRLTKEGIKKTKPLWDKADVVRAKQQGNNVWLSRKQKAGEVIEASAKDKGKIKRHEGHDIGDGKKGNPHYQEDGVRGHVFYGPLSAAVGAVLTGLDVLEQLDPLFIKETTACDVLPPNPCNPNPSGLGPNATEPSAKEPGSPGSDPGDDRASNQVGAICRSLNDTTLQLNLGGPVC